MQVTFVGTGDAFGSGGRAHTCLRLDHDGRALMIKAGYSGSGINDIVYMGEVVNSAAKLANQASATALAPPILVNDSFYESLDDQNKSFFSRDWSRRCYAGDVVNIEMNDWVKAQ